MELDVVNVQSEEAVDEAAVIVAHGTSASSAEDTANAHMTVRLPMTTWCGKELRRMAEEMYHVVAVQDMDSKAVVEAVEDTGSMVVAALTEDQGSGFRFGFVRGMSFFFTEIGVSLFSVVTSQKTAQPKPGQSIYTPPRRKSRFRMENFFLRNHGFPHLCGTVRNFSDCGATEQA